MKFKLKDHQEHDLGKMIANTKGVFIGATGCGKTFSEAAYVHHYVTTTPNPKINVVVAPTINLVKQVAQEFTKFFHDRGTLFQAITLYSGDEVNIRHDSYILDQSDNKPKTATSASQVVEQASLVDIPVIVFVTYKSLYKLADTEASQQLSIHALICDEAHNIYYDKLRPSNGVQDVINVDAEKKFFFTATPVGDGDYTQLFNADVHGEVLAVHTHYDMVKVGAVLPYRLMMLRNSDLDAASGVADLSVDQVADVIMLAYVQLREHCGVPTKMLVMMKDTAFVRDVARRIEEMRDDDLDVYASGAGTWTGDLVNGQEVGRDKLLKRLKKNDGRNAIVLNVSVFGEGVDVAGINGTLFLTGCGDIKISQSCGRAARLAPEDRARLASGELTPIVDVDKFHKAYGYVIIPCYGAEEQAIATDVQRVVTILRRQDAYVCINAVEVNATGSEMLSTGRTSKLKEDITREIDITVEIEDAEQALRDLAEKEAADAEIRRIQAQTEDEFWADVLGE